MSSIGICGRRGSQKVLSEALNYWWFYEFFLYYFVILMKQMWKVSSQTFICVIWRCTNRAAAECEHDADHTGHFILVLCVSFIFYLSCEMRNENCFPPHWAGSVNSLWSLCGCYWILDQHSCRSITFISSYRYRRVHSVYERCHITYTNLLNC